jgi:hypothetical protein
MGMLRTGKGEPTTEKSGGKLLEKPRFTHGCRVAAVVDSDDNSMV